MRRSTNRSIGPVLASDPAARRQRALSGLQDREKFGLGHAIARHDQPDQRITHELGKPRGGMGVVQHPEPFLRVPSPTCRRFGDAAIARL